MPVMLGPGGSRIGTGQRLSQPLTPARPVASRRPRRLTRSASACRLFLRPRQAEAACPRAYRYLAEGVFALARTRVGTVRAQAEPWRCVEVVAAGGPHETAAAMRRAMRLLAEPFREWLRHRPGEGSPPPGGGSPQAGDPAGPPSP